VENDSASRFVWAGGVRQGSNTKEMSPDCSESLGCILLQQKPHDSPLVEWVAFKKRRFHHMNESKINAATKGKWKRVSRDTLFPFPLDWHGEARGKTMGNFMFPLRLNAQEVEAI
jgi:hypothetical protein